MDCCNKPIRNLVMCLCGEFGVLQEKCTSGFSDFGKRIRIKPEVKIVTFFTLFFFSFCVYRRKQSVCWDVIALHHIITEALILVLHCTIFLRMFSYSNMSTVKSLGDHTSLALEQKTNLIEVCLVLIFLPSLLSKHRFLF